MNSNKHYIDLYTNKKIYIRTSQLCEEGTISSSFLEVKMSIATK